MGLLVTIYMFSFSDDDNYIFNDKYYKRVTSIVLLLLFHECLGHQKKHINNENALTPGKHCQNTLQEINLEKVDSGSTLEIILLGKTADLIYFMNSDNSERLLNPKLYSGKDFTELREIYSINENDNDNINKNGNKKDNNEINIQFNDIHSPKKVRKITKKRLLMYTDLIRLYSGISDEEKEKLKDDENYQRFLLLYERKHKSPSENLKIPDRYGALSTNKKK